jgi:RNA polymerase sigma-70 factor, ECF subfamily
MEPPATDLERAVRDRLASGDSVGAATAAIEALGPEILGFLAAIVRGEEEAREVFAQFCEELWVGLPRFDWRTPLRTWAYTLARQAIERLRSDPHRDPARRVPLSQSPEVRALEQRAWTRTPMHLQSQVKSELTALRDALPEADRVLLVLRVDRGMSFSAIASITLGTIAAADEATLQREAARLRKRFQLVKEELRASARQRGLLGDTL